MTARIDKAIAPLIMAGLVALTALLSGGVVDVSALQSALITTASGLITAGFVYFVNYNHRFPSKALAALLPLAAMILQALHTGEFNEPEFLLAVQAVLGAAWTYFARYLPVLPPTDPPVAHRARP